MVQRTLAISNENLFVLMANQPLNKKFRNGSDLVASTKTYNQPAIYRNTYSNLIGVIK